MCRVFFVGGGGVGSLKERDHLVNLWVAVTVLKK
jgi:hypothetical protein